MVAAAGFIEAQLFGETGYKSSPVTMGRVLAARKR
jgi:hypothetical protein